MRNDLVIKYSSFIILAFTGLILIYYFLFAPPKNFPVQTIFSIENGSSLAETSQDLKAQELIQSELALQFFAVLFGDDRHIVAGDYVFDQPIAVWEVAYRISLGKLYQKAIKVTIPEGFKVEEIAELLSESLLNFNREDFLAQARSLEGYLFPDTYFLYPTMDPKEVLELMQDNFKSQITPLEREIKKSGHTLSEIVIMASLIEKESGSLEDKAPISGILWKRIEKDIRLQVDAWPPTYEKMGLPESPIANPGIDSIKAALYPAETEYLFYIHGDDGQIYYAKTFDEHRLNIRKYL